MSDKIETRTNENHELRIVDEGTRKVGGYAALFDVSTRIKSMFGSGFDEKIAKGAFATSLASARSIAALWNHNTDLVIGDTGNQSLLLREDDKGLAFDLHTADTSAGRDAYNLIKGNFVRGVSFGFKVKKETWERGTDTTPPKRTIQDVELFEISPTRFPAYDQTSVVARSSEEVLKEVESNWAFEDNERKKKETPGPTIEQLKAALAFQELRIRLS